MESKQKMKRKINRVGTGTLTVSLPSKWATKYDLKQGDEVEVVEEGSKLSVSTESIKREPKKLFIEIKENNKRVIRGFLYGAYKNNFDEIEISFKDESILKSLSKEAEGLLGFEIISQKKGHCVLKNVATPNRDSFNDLVNKIFLLTISFANDTFEAIKRKENESLNNIELQESTQNKIVLASIRILQLEKENIVLYPQLMHYVLSELEAIGDDIKYICQYHKNYKINLNKETEKLFYNFIEHLRKTYSLYLKFNLEDLQNEVVLREPFIKEANKLIESSEKDQRVLITHLSGAYLKSFDVLRNIFQINVK